MGALAARGHPVPPPGAPGTASQGPAIPALTGRLDFLWGFPEGCTVSPAARKAAILDSMFETWRKDRQTSLGSPFSMSRTRKGSCSGIIEFTNMTLPLRWVSRLGALPGGPHFHPSSMVTGRVTHFQG